jgi:NitT/TauT family transport system substrate-binding protein
MDPTAVNSLIHIAGARGYFAAGGLEVTVKEYASGLAAVNGMLDGEVEVATAAEFVLVGKALVNERICTFGTIDKFIQIELIGRKDRGIGKATDLTGKRIGVPLKTAAEFYLGRFLELNGLGGGQAALVNVGPLQSADALAGGEVDAVVTWPPFVKAIEERLGNGVVRWPVQNEQATYCSAVCTTGWAAGHPLLIDRFLDALVRAEIYAAGHPEEAKSIVQKALRYDDSYMAVVWPQHRLSVSLDQSLVIAMEDEARWMIANHLTDEKAIPVFLDYIYLDGLKAVRPEAVNVVE